MPKHAPNLVLTIFHCKFYADLLPTVNAFKAARLFLPPKINDIKPDTSTVDSLRAFKFLSNSEIIDNLKSELPTYLTTAEDVAADVAPLT